MCWQVAPNPTQHFCWPCYPGCLHIQSLSAQGSSEVQWSQYIGQEQEPFQSHEDEAIIHLLVCLAKINSIQQADFVCKYLNRSLKPTGKICVISALLSAVSTLAALGHLAFSPTTASSVGQAITNRRLLMVSGLNASVILLQGWSCLFSTSEN